MGEREESKAEQASINVLGAELSSNAWVRWW